MSWYHYALLFYWLVAGFWLFLEASEDVSNSYIVSALLGMAFGWLAVPAILLGRVLR